MVSENCRLREQAVKHSCDKLCHNQYDSMSGASANLLIGLVLENYVLRNAFCYNKNHLH